MGCQGSKNMAHQPCHGHDKLPADSLGALPSFANKSSGSSTQSTRSGSSLASIFNGSKAAATNAEWQGTFSGSSLSSQGSQGQTILGKYAFAGERRVVLGEGTWSVCCLGSDVETGERVAIKVYKHHSKADAARTLTKFRRQVNVLLELQRPFRRPTGQRPALWCQELAHVEPSDLFVGLLAYSKDAEGQPGRDPVDNSMYIVTELADYTLHSVLKQCRLRDALLSAEKARKAAKEIVIAVAGLHAKGFVHLDIKPANIMMCKGRWKLIDMDGCVRAGKKIGEHDTSVSFSSCYCAPEFARFVHKGGNIVASPSLDVWSVGMTIAELYVPEPLMRARYQEISDGDSREDGGKRFLQWLGGLKAPPVPPRAQFSDQSFAALLSGWMLVPNDARRRTLVDSLSAPYFAPQGCGGAAPEASEGNAAASVDV